MGEKAAQGEQSETGAQVSGYPSQLGHSTSKGQQAIDKRLKFNLANSIWQIQSGKFNLANSIWNYESIVTKRFIFGHSMGLIL
jgi:hypothetical protein